MAPEVAIPQPPHLDTSSTFDGVQSAPADLGGGNDPTAIDQNQQSPTDGSLDPQKVTEVGAGGSRDQVLSASEQTQTPEIQRRNEVESAAFTLIKAEAVQSYRRASKADIKNPAEDALNRLGKFLCANTIPRPVARGESLLRETDEEGQIHGTFEKNNPLPRLKQTADTDQWITAYDDRADASDEAQTDIGPGVVQLERFIGKTAGNLYHFRGSDAQGPYAGNIVLTENALVKAVMVAQTNELRNGLSQDAPEPSAESGLRKPAVRKMIATMVGTCGEFVDHYDADDEEGLDLVGDVDESSVKEALKEGNVTISKEAGLTLAQSMIDYNQKNLAGLPAEQVATIASALEKAQAEINAGIQPSAEQLYQILVLVGEPGLRSQLDATEETIATIKQRLLQSLPEAERDRLSKDLNRSIQERESLKRVLINNKNNEVFHLLEDAQNGKMDPDLVGLLNDKIAGITDPKGFFELKPEDLDDKNSLASIIVKHFAIKHGVDDTKMEAWLSKFFREHGSDIAMMGIFALFQMMTQMIGDAAKNA